MSRLSDLVYVRKSAGDFSTLVNSFRGDVRFLIVDRTGLTGNFEWDLTYAMPGFGELSGNRKQNAPFLEDALQEQLGLRLVRSTGAGSKARHRLGRDAVAELTTEVTGSHKEFSPL